jgi:hypothetical protein
MGDTTGRVSIASGFQNGAPRDWSEVEPPDDDRQAPPQTYEEQLDLDVARRARSIKVDRLARARVDAEAAGGLATFDAALLEEVLTRAPAPPHRVEGLIPAEAGTLLVAQRKIGKTTLELNLTGSLIEGHDFLGRFGVRPVDGNVAILNFEVSAGTLATWACDHQIPRHRLLLVNLRGRRNPFRQPADLEQLASILRRHDVETLIVDPFGRAYTGTSQNDPGEVGAWLTDLDRFARQDGAGCVDVILTAHAGWNGERTRGSTALDDWADSIVTIARDPETGQRFLRAEGRDVLVEEDQLSYDHRTRRLTLAGTGSRKATSKIRQVEALMPAVMDLLRETPSMSGNQLDRALTELIKSGDLDTAHSKGDGARAAQLLERRHLVASKDGARGARLFTLLTSPTSPNVPEGTQATSPPPLYRGVARGSEHLDLPSTEETP